MARNTKVGSMYVGVGMDTRDFQRKQKQLKSGTQKMGKDFKKLNDDISNLPFFGRFVDDFKRMAASIKSVVGVAKGASAVSGASKGKAGVGGGKARAAIAGLQAAEIARESAADKRDYAIQEKQNALIQSGNSQQVVLEEKAAQLQAKLLDEQEKMADLMAENKRLEELQLKAMKATSTRAGATKAEKKSSKAVADFEDDLKTLANTVAVFQDAQKMGIEVTNEQIEAYEREQESIAQKLKSEKEYLLLLRQMINRQKEGKATRTDIERDLQVQKVRIQQQANSLGKATAANDEFAQKLERSNEQLRDQRIQKERDEEQRRIDATLTGKAFKHLKMAAEIAGDGLAKVGADVGTGVGVTAAGGKEGSNGSITGKLLTGLGIANLMKRFPKLNAMMMQFAKYALSTKASMVIVGGVIVGSIVVGLAAAVVSMKKFVGLGNEAAEEFDKMSKQAKLLGVNVNQLNTLRQQGIALAGMEAKAVDVAIQRFTRRLSDGTLDKKLVEMGFTLREISQLKMDNPANALEKVRVKFAAISSEGERLRLAFSMFDTEGAKFALALSEQGRQLDKLNAKMERYGLTITENQQRALEATKKLNEELDRQAEGTATQVGAAAAGVSESWNKLWTDLKEATRIQDLFNVIAVKGMKLFEIAIDTVRVTMIPLIALGKTFFAVWDMLSETFGGSNGLAESLAPVFEWARKISAQFYGILDPVIDLIESTLEFFGYETAITDELEKQDALREKMAADREKELTDIEAKTKAAKRELEVLKKGEMAVKSRELSDEYLATVAGGKMEGETDAEYEKRRKQARDDFMKARAEYRKQYQEQMKAEKDLADFKEKRAKEIAAIESKHEEEMKRLNETADRERSDAESAGSDRISMLGSLFGSQSFTAGQSFGSGSNEEYSYLRDLRMSEQRRNEEKEARKEMQTTLDSIDTHLEESLRIENAWYQSEANSYASDNIGVEANQFSGIDPS